MFKFSEHFAFILNTFTILAVDEETESVLYEAYGEVCCEISGREYRCTSIEDFYDFVEICGEKIH